MYQPPKRRSTATSGANQNNNNNQNLHGNGRQQRRNTGKDGNLHRILQVNELEQIQKDIRDHQLLIGSSDLLNRMNVCFK